MGADQEPKAVVCASCGKTIALSDADVITFGTGFRCEHCTLDSEVSEHLRQAALNEAARLGQRYSGRPEFDPSVRQVAAAVEEARAGAGASASASPTPESIEPIVEADDERRAETMATLGKAQAPSIASADAVVGLAADGPYRSSSGTVLSPRYVCIVCFRSSADVPGLCARDQVPLSDLENPEAVQAVREEVRGRANRREGWRFGTSFAVGLVSAVATAIIFDLPIGRRGGWPGLVWMLISAVVYSGSHLLVPALKARNRAPDLLQALGVHVSASAAPMLGPGRAGEEGTAGRQASR